MGNQVTAPAGTVFDGSGWKTPGDPDKKAILVVSFGTSYHDTREAAIGAVEKRIAEAFPDYEVRRAFTSQMIIDKLAARDNLQIDNVRQAMERLVKDGFGTVVCQPTHVMNGFEFEKMIGMISPYIDKFSSIQFGKPLLSSIKDYEELVKVLQEELPPLTKKEAAVLVGHGTEHFANAVYCELDYRMKDEGCGNIFVGTVEGYPSVDSVLKRLRANPEIEKVYLVPLMIVAGDHAIHDITGGGKDSWKRILTDEGYQAVGVLKGLGEYQGVRNLFVKHVQAAIAGEE